MKRAPKNKRRAPLSHEAWDTLRDYLCARLLPPRPQALTSKKLLDRFAAGEPDPRDQWEQTRDKLRWEIELCWPRAHEPLDDYVETPWQIEAMEEDLKKHGWEVEDLNEDIVISCMLNSTLELEPETRAYLAKEWMKRVPLPRPPSPEWKQREFAQSVKNLKRLLRGSPAIRAGDADNMIAAGLRLPSGAALRQRLQRTPRE